MFDVVLMDVMMPGTDGLEATRLIRALPGPEARVPILAVTASAFAEDIEACREAGMDAHLAKPIELDALVAALARLTDAAPPPPVAAPPAVDLAVLPLLGPHGGEALLIPGMTAAAARSLTAEFVRELRDATQQLREAKADSIDHMAPAAHRLAGAASNSWRAPPHRRVAQLPGRGPPGGAGSGIAAAPGA